MSCVCAMIAMIAITAITAVVDTNHIASRDVCRLSDPLLTHGSLILSICQHSGIDAPLELICLLTAANPIRMLLTSISLSLIVSDFWKIYSNFMLGCINF